MSHPTDNAQAQAGRVETQHAHCASQTRAALRDALDVIENASARISSGEDHSRVLKELSAALKACKPAKKITAATKTFHESLKSLGNAIEELCVDNICAAARAERLPADALNQVILDHLYREGRFDVGDLFLAEAKLTDVAGAKDAFMDMHRITKQMTEGNLRGALDWVLARRDALSFMRGQPAALEFKLHRLIFLGLLQQQGAAVALEYAQGTFERFKDTNMADIQRLMCCLVYAKTPLAHSPYSDLVSPDRTVEVVHDFAKAACGLLGQACESPLLVAVAAGSEALPTLLKYAAISKRSSTSQFPDIATAAELAINLDLGPEFTFHSIFACPVSQEQSDQHNPPMMLPCGHVLCAHSIQNISKKDRKVFKCPYCPEETQAKHCRILKFPDVQ